MILRILALALLVLAGCSPLEPGSLRVDPDDALSSHVAEAALRIHAAIGVTIQVGSGKGAALRVPARLVPADTLQPSAGTLPKGCDSDAACEWSGHFDGKTILVNETASADKLGATVLHEMVHALMLSGQHLEDVEELEDKNGLMSAVREVDCLTEGDLDFICGRISCAWFVSEACD